MNNIFARRAAIAALSARDQEILTLARKAVNSMGFACQGAAQGSENMEIRYERQASEYMQQLEDLLLNQSTNTPK